MNPKFKKNASKRSNRQAKSSKTIANVVKTVLSSNEETKFVLTALANLQSGTNLGTFTPFTSAITSTSEVFICLPQVQQGDDDNQRVGNVIQPKSCIVRGTVTLRGTNLESESVYADLYFMSSKSVKDQAASGALPITEMLNYGNGFNGAYDGTSYSAQFPINKADFNLIKHIRVLLSKGAGDPNTALSGTAVADASADTFSYSRTFNVKIPCPAKLLYKDSTTVYPTNHYPFLVVGFHGSDQQGGTVPVNPRIQVQAQTQLYYKDS